jgi:hypothetical protein
MLVRGDKGTYMESKGYVFQRLGNPALTLFVSTTRIAKITLIQRVLIIAVRVLVIAVRALIMLARGTDNRCKRTDREGR